MLLVEFDAVLVTHDHVLLQGDRSIAPRVCLVKELAQSCNFQRLISHKELSLYFTYLGAGVGSVYS